MPVNTDGRMEKGDKIKQKRERKRRCVKVEGKGGVEMRGPLIFHFFKKKCKQQGIQVTLLL